MKTGVYLEDISDGRIYDIDDLACVDAKGCHGCSACCEDVGDLVTLTPFDLYQIKLATGESTMTLLQKKCNLIPDGKLFFPHLKMQGDQKRCLFLNDKNRCSIHAHRPNICRLFPLGRFYDSNDLGYFLQKNACTKDDLGEIAIREWIAIHHYEENKSFLLQWYTLNKALQFRMKFIRDDEEILGVQNLLFEMLYDIDAASEVDFYNTFHQRLSVFKKELGLI